jgi:hypothetical protein
MLVCVKHSPFSAQAAEVLGYCGVLDIVCLSVSRNPRLMKVHVLRLESEQGQGQGETKAPVGSTPSPHQTVNFAYQH